MEVRTCRSCKKIFQYSGIGEVLCPTCKQKDEEDFERVKKFIQANPGAGGTQISEATEVPMTRIAKWMREERLIINNSSGLLVCAQCGKPIPSGKLCVECKSKLAQGFAAAGQKNTAKPAAASTTSSQPTGMRFIKT